MTESLEQLEWVVWMDSRQQSRVRHKLKDILVIVLFATFADVDDWVEIGMFAKIHEVYLRKYLRLENGVPSHDTIQRAMAMMSPEVFQRIQADFREIMNREEGEKLKKIIGIDGKTMRGNQRNGEKPSHIVSAWSDEDKKAKPKREKPYTVDEVAALLGTLEGQPLYVPVMLAAVFDLRRSEALGLRLIGKTRRSPLTRP